MDLVDRFKPRTPWPEPELSIGERFCDIKHGKFTCWEAVGRARTAWELVGPEIKRYLNDISLPTLSPVTVSIEVYMIGKTPSTAAPIIWISCIHKQTRKRIRCLIRDNHFIDGYPGMGLGDAPKGPDGQTPVALGGTSDSPSGSGYPERDERIVGRQLLAYTSSGELRTATGGHLVWIREKPYQLTVAHFLRDDLALSTGQSVDAVLEECSFDGDSDSETVEELSEQDSLSDWSRTADDLLSRDSNDETSSSRNDLDRSVSLPSGPSGDLPGYTQQAARVPESRRGATVSRKVAHPDASTEKERQTVEPVGEVFLTSEDGTQPGLDYALIELTDIARYPIRASSPCRGDIVQKPSTDVMITAITASAGRVTGRFSMRTPSYIQAAGSQVFQKAFMVHLNTAFREGDCGAPVLDDNGGLYGHIVAATPNTGYAYVVPASEIMKDVTQITGHEVTLRPPASHSVRSGDIASRKSTLMGTLDKPATPRLPGSPDLTPSANPVTGPASIFPSPEAAAKLHSVLPTSEQQTGVAESKTKSKAKRENLLGPEADHMDCFPRLSNPVELLRSEYDVVVIGSGYGGGVAASRMARTGQSVCVLERGRERWPGEYPTKTAEALKEMHSSGTLAPGQLKGKVVEGGDPTGLYHLILGRGQNAVVCNGLGGTSLINANVFMEADKKTLAMKAWPPQIRENPDCLDKYYKKAESVLEPEAYPEDWPKLPKLEMLQKQAEALGYGDRFRRVRQTTRFRDGPNSVGVEMSASELTGQDATGVNDGSKNSTLVTYIADAWNWGAEVFCECEVRYIQKLPDNKGYLVFYAWHGRNRGAFKANLHGDLMWVHAKKAVFLGAGSIASTEILLRSKAMGLEMSTEVGQNMSGNGDILSFGCNTDEKVNSIGRAVPDKSNPVGPCIAGIIDCRENNDSPLDGFVIEEGTVPSALAHVLQFMLDSMLGSVEPNEPLHKRTQAAFARYGSRFLGPYFKGDALERTQIYLIMSHDSNQAVLSLKDDKPVLEFLGVARSNHTKYLNGLLAKATQAVGGTLVQNPFFALMGQHVTVHPIGGACMAHDNTGNTGVTNHVGEVFIGDGPETHDGLIVTDAAVIPTTLGANPFATITALAERSVEHYAVSKGLTISEERNGIIDLFGEPAHSPPRNIPPSQDSSILEEHDSMTIRSDVVSSAKAIRASGFGFTEVMTGFVHHDPKLKTDERETYELAYRTAQSRCESARFFLSIQSFDTTTTLKNHQHRSMLTGTFTCASIPGSPFMVQRGELNLFILNNKAPGTRSLTYDFDMKGVDSRKLHFHGYKVVDSSVALSPKNFWRATTTLYVSISEHVPGMCADFDDEDAWRSGRVLAKGIMYIKPKDFASEVLTMTPTGSSLLQKALSAASFLTFFTRQSLSLFLAPLARLQYPSQSYSGFINDTPPSQIINITALDGIVTRLLVWEPTAHPDNDPSQTRNLFMIPGAAVDHQIYALPTIPFNAVNYFTRAGYRVYVTVHRIGQLAVAETLHTTYDARLDLLACLETIRALHGPHPVYTIAHCMGSVAFASGLLDGTIPASYVLGVTASQVFMNPVWGPANMAKVLAGPVPMDKLYTSLARSTWFNCSSYPDDTLVQRAINQLLRLYPQSRREMCANAACHRCSLVFGRCWNHENLNEATHRQIDRFFGGVNMRLLNLLMKMGYDGHVMTNAPEYTPLDTPDNIERLRGIPFLLFVGRDNAVLSVESTERTYEALTDAFGDVSEYKRRVVPGYGHLDPWMGRNAWKDVYPFVREEVDRVVRGEGYRFVEPEDKWKRMVEEGVMLY